MNGLMWLSVNLFEWLFLEKRDINDSPFFGLIKIVYINNIQQTYW